MSLIWRSAPSSADAQQRGGHRRGDRLAHQPDELLVLLVERAVRVEAGHDDGLQVRIVDAERDATRRAVPVSQSSSSTTGRSAVAACADEVAARSDVGERRPQAGDPHDAVGDDEVDLDRRQRRRSPSTPRRSPRRPTRSWWRSRARRRVSRARAAGGGRRPAAVVSVATTSKPATRVGVVVDRAVGVGEERLFGVAVAIDQQSLIGVAHCFARRRTRSRTAGRSRPRSPPTSRGRCRPMPAGASRVPRIGRNASLYTCVYSRPHTSIIGNSEVSITWTRSCSCSGQPVDRAERSRLPRVRDDASRGVVRTRVDRRGAARRTNQSLSPSS